MTKLNRNRGKKEFLLIHIPLVCPTLNKWYAGQHWTKRKKVADEWHEAIWLFCKEAKIKLFEGKFPVNITTRTFFKGKRKRDTSNCFPANKLAEDGLVKAGILPDDTVEYVLRHIVFPPVINYGSDMTLIKLEEANESILP